MMNNDSVGSVRILPTVFLFCAFCFMFSPAGAQVTLNTDGQDSAYVENIKLRAQKIVEGMGISDAQKALCVRNIIANRYFLLNTIHTQYEQTMKFANDSLLGGRREHVREGAARKRDAELYKHHFELEAALSLYVDAAGIEAVKDGMTYGVVPKTYHAHLEMIPSLTTEEKAQILAWLKEAREFAMDAGTSKDKHGWFGKYKGRINNWLSARGYDLQKEREGWQQRIEEQKKKAEK